MPISSSSQRRPGSVCSLKPTRPGGGRAVSVFVQVPAAVRRMAKYLGMFALEVSFHDTYRQQDTALRPTEYLQLPPSVSVFDTPVFHRMPSYFDVYSSPRSIDTDNPLAYPSHSISARSVHNLEPLRIERSFQHVFSYAHPTRTRNFHSIRRCHVGSASSNSLVMVVARLARPVAIIVYRNIIFSHLLG